MLSFGRIVALASFIFSLGTIAIAYAYATAYGYSALCNPFIDGCSDITHAGMQGTGGMLFRAGIIIACVCFILWWSCMSLWLKPHANNISRRLMWFFGVVSAIGLIVGTAVLLPSEEESLWVVHIKGANLFFQAGLLAFILNYRLIYVRHKYHQKVPSFQFKSILFVLIMFVSIAFAIYGVKQFMSKGEIVMEWWSTLFVGLYYLSSFWDWKNLRLSVVS